MNDALRAAMNDAGATVESLAERAQVDPKTVARWLSPGRIPHARHRAAAADALGRDIRDLWPDTSRRRDPVWFRPWQEIEREAVALRWFESVVLPGLLQTEAYAQAVLEGAGLVAPAQVQRRLAARMARQAILERDDPPQLTAVIDETVLRRPIGGRQTMHEQLCALTAGAERPHVRVHVVPASVGAYAGLNGPFVIATSTDRRTACYLDNQLEGHLASAAEDIAVILDAWEAVRGEALNHRQSIELIKDVAKTWS